MTNHDKSLVTSVIVLEAHRKYGGSPVDRVENACERARVLWPDFDFVHWAGCTYGELLFDMCWHHGWIEGYAGLLSEKGLQFLRVARERLVEVGALTFLEEP